MTCTPLIMIVEKNSTNYDCKKLPGPNILEDLIPVKKSEAKNVFISKNVSDILKSPRYYGRCDKYHLIDFNCGNKYKLICNNQTDKECVLSYDDTTSKYQCMCCYKYF